MGMLILPERWNLRLRSQARTHPGMMFSQLICGTLCSTHEEITLGGSGLAQVREGIQPNLDPVDRAANGAGMTRGS